MAMLKTAHPRDLESEYQVIDSDTKHIIPFEWVDAVTVEIPDEYNGRATFLRTTWPPSMRR